MKKKNLAIIDADLYTLTCSSVAAAVIPTFWGWLVAKVFFFLCSKGPKLIVNIHKSTTI